MFLDYHSYGEIILIPNDTKAARSDSNTGKIIIPNSLEIYSKKGSNLREMAKIAAAAMKNATTKNRIYRIRTSESLARVPAVVGNQQNKLDIAQYLRISETKYKTLTSYNRIS